MAIVTFPGLSINSLPQNSSLRGPMPTISIRVALLLAMALVAADPSMIAKKEPSALRRRLPSPRHVLCNGLPDIEVSEDCGHHCALRPRVLINCSMFLTSSATSLLISCGVLLATMLPFSVNFAISSGVWDEQACG